MEFKEKIMLHCFPEIKCQHGVIKEIGCSLTNLLASQRGRVVIGFSILLL